MSKQLGNSPDALKLIDRYGADGVRAGMLLLSSGAGNDLLFDESKCQQGKAFTNKIWNAFRLIKGWKLNSALEQSELNKSIINWYESRFQQVLLEVEDHFEKYRLSDALMSIYKLIWDDFCSWLLEVVKPTYGQSIDEPTYKAVICFLEDNLKILHPFMPFVTEEIWQYLRQRNPDQALIIASWPKKVNFDTEVIETFGFAKGVISGVRTLRKERQIAFKEKLRLSVINHAKRDRYFEEVVIKLCNLECIAYSEAAIDDALSFRVGANEYFVPIENSLNIAEEIAKLEGELNYVRGFLTAVQKKLSNQRFVENAPDKVVAMERKKEADAQSKIKTIEAGLLHLKS